MCTLYIGRISYNNNIQNERNLLFHCLPMRSVRRNFSAGVFKKTIQLNEIEVRKKYRFILTTRYQIVGTHFYMYTI